MKDFILASFGLLDLNFPLINRVTNQEIGPESQHAFSALSILTQKQLRWTLIADYWFKLVPLHLLLIMSASTSVYFLFGFAHSRAFGVVFIPVSLITFGVLLVMIYLPNFLRRVLPALEILPSIGPLSESSRLEKCRQTQFSNPALCLVLYVLQQTSGMEELQANDKTATALNQLLGVDSGSLKKNLDFFFGTSAKRKNLSERKVTEIRNQFKEASGFFEALSFPRGIEILEKLEESVLK